MKRLSYDQERVIAGVLLVLAIAVVEIRCGALTDAGKLALSPL
jgi:hypothetical protein